MTTFIILRHGQTNWNLNHRYQGQMDIPLNAYGEEQARNAYEFLKQYHFDEVYCSDLYRARMTAKLALGDLFPLDRIHYDRRLRERSFGIYEGGPYDKERMPQEYVKQMKKDPENFKFPEGESLRDVERRIRPFVEEMKEKYPGKTVLIVAHGTLLSCMTCVVHHTPVIDRTRYHYQNAEPAILEVN